MPEWASRTKWRRGGGKCQNQNQSSFKSWSRIAMYRYLYRIVSIWIWILSYPVSAVSGHFSVAGSFSSLPFPDDHDTIEPFLQGQWQRNLNLHTRSDSDSDSDSDISILHVYEKTSKQANKQTKTTIARQQQHQHQYQQRDEHSVHFFERDNVWQSKAISQPWEWIINFTLHNHQEAQTTMMTRMKMMKMTTTTSKTTTTTN